MKNRNVKRMLLTFFAMAAMIAFAQKGNAQGAAQFLKGNFTEKTSDTYATAEIDLLGKTYDSENDEVGKCYGYIEYRYPGMREGWYIIEVDGIDKNGVIEGAEPCMWIVPESAPDPSEKIQVAFDFNPAKKTLSLEGWNKDDFYPMTLTKVK